MWHFCSCKDAQKIEKLQKRALRLIYNDYTSSYEDMLKMANLPYLEVHRLRCIAIECFKIMSRSNPVYINDLLQTFSTTYNLRKSNTFSIPQVRMVNYGKKIFHLLWSCGVSYHNI